MLSFDAVEFMTKNEYHIFLHYWVLAITTLETIIITCSISCELEMDLLLKIECL